MPKQTLETLIKNFELEKALRLSNRMQEKLLDKVENLEDIIKNMKKWHTKCDVLILEKEELERQLHESEFTNIKELEEKVRDNNVIQAGMEEEIDRLKEIIEKLDDKLNSYKSKIRFHKKKVN